MAPIAILFGVLLGLLGPLLYFLSDPAKQSLTALIPSGFGIGLFVCGIFARNEKARMHVMHAAAFLGLVGFAIPAFMVARSLIGGAEFDPVKHGGQIAMAALCLIFLGLCVKSFIDARIARKQKEAESQSPAH
jgi:uncharacterized membrane protein